MNATRFFILLISFLILIVGCSSSSKVFQIHKILCADIIYEGTLIYNHNIDSLQSKLEYQEMIKDLSTCDDLLHFWTTKMDH